MLGLALCQYVAVLQRIAKTAATIVLNLCSGAANLPGEDAIVLQSLSSG
jgi:hypothetical protein